MRGLSLVFYLSFTVLSGSFGGFNLASVSSLLESGEVLAYPLDFTLYLILGLFCSYACLYFTIGAVRELTELRGHWRKPHES